jgi:cytochrome c-type biogenesis protein CcmH
MILFWVLCAVLTAAAVTLVMRRAFATVSPEAGESVELQTHRRALAELDELKARELIDEQGWRAARAEAGRRLLAAADAGADTPKADLLKHRRIVLLVLAAVAPMALGLYIVTGAPGLPDSPYGARLAQWRATDPATLEPAAQAAILEVAVRERPNDVLAWRFLGQARADTGDMFGAAQALQNAVRLAPGDARLWTLLGAVLVELGGGTLSPDARQAFERAVQIDPSQQIARAFLEGRQAELVAADQAQQAQAIRGMVEGLAARLEEAPNDPAGWARLVRSYTVLNDTTARDAALARARQLFADRPADLAAIEQAAQAQPPQ